MGKSSDPKIQKKQNIIAAAAQVFSQKGYAAAVMADIAVAAGIGKGTIYEYFDSKEDLFFAVFLWLSQEIMDKTSLGLADIQGSATQRLLALNRSLMRAGTEMSDAFSLVMEFWAASSTSQWKDRLKPAFRQAYQDYRTVVRSLLQEGIDRGEFRLDVDPEKTAAVLVGAWDALFLQAWFDPDFDPEAAAEHFIPIVIRGLSARSPDG